MDDAVLAPKSSEFFDFPTKFLERMAFVVNKVAERIDAQIESVVAPLGLTFRQYGVLVFLQSEGSHAQIAIGQRIGLDRTSVMRIVDVLEQRSLVRRDADPSDRRKHSVVLTEAGSELLARTFPEVQRAENKLYAALSEQEQAQLLSLLRRLLEFNEMS